MPAHSIGHNRQRKHAFAARARLAQKRRGVLVILAHLPHVGRHVAHHLQCVHPFRHAFFLVSTGVHRRRKILLNAGARIRRRLLQRVLEERDRVA